VRRSLPPMLLAAFPTLMWKGYSSSAYIRRVVASAKRMELMDFARFMSGRGWWGGWGI